MTTTTEAGTGTSVEVGTGQDHRLSPAQRRAILAGAVGNTVEWVDWAVYATFAPVFAQQFFAPGNETAALLSTLAVFAVGFVMRPIGGAVLGAYSDRHGRKKGLTLTISLMAGASLVIAVCPTYSQIGVLAPLVLLLARLVQGFSAGGEFGSSSAFLIESAARGRRAFAGSWQQVSVGAGALIASLLGTILNSALDEAQLHGWGWRLAFGIGGLLGLVGLWLRRSVHETEAFTRIKDRPRRNPLVTMVRDHPRAALRVVGMTIAGTLIYYVWVTYMPTYAHLATGIPLREALLANTLAIVVFLVLLPFGGLLSDRIGRKPTMAAFAGGFLLFSWPAFHFLAANFWSLLVIEIAGMVLIVGYSANCAVIMAEQFPAEVRTTGIGLPYALAVAVFGGTAPYVTTWMNAHHFGHLVWVYVAVAALVGLAVYTTMPETKGKEL
ncbi:MFS transporter, MHS family, alpha-ketoglutarate permease [Streptoalloteichus tenebrarius]|uniref:MFS transporter, MHS family, alpha-ketoglutarate permease n=1 Tax=Streptoalloteichus tenebrarius (strain ATCC 17920 / DSM 40477 / JCM 4838 / CBS 697.72 / NBRC 16177 / NCIMB 11028 / NRRL B-12390 / A12253. 1 / ISP 5477) TaxID=1933 RepID=A0ABT1HZM1_STRSD|nr:MFS transporter [Streptoalloteichus tenebrarius]MCP2260976.1 MFS transporter, MHS family, alpha-ketoglutarate permease [Streptoalloteichus tenebrarius]BFE98914.1 MFS transporter [Streptoalloteichus tenebrarius]